MIILVDARNFHTLTPEATEYLKQSNNLNRIATAVVSDNLSQKILGAYMARGASHPVKIFHTESEAVKWLLLFQPEI